MCIFMYAFACVCTYTVGLMLILVSFLIVPYFIYLKSLILCTCVCLSGGLGS